MVNVVDGSLCNGNASSVLNVEREVDEEESEDEEDVDESIESPRTSFIETLFLILSVVSNVFWSLSTEFCSVRDVALPIVTKLGRILSKEAESAMPACVAKQEAKSAT